jgi:hypothetical protein
MPFHLRNAFSCSISLLLSIVLTYLRESDRSDKWLGLWNVTEPKEAKYSMSNISMSETMLERLESLRKCNYHIPILALNDASFPFLNASSRFCSRLIHWTFTDIFKVVKRSSADT